MELLPDWREFIELLNFHSVDYIIVGARSLHGVPRSTGDIDFFVRSTPENADRLIRVLNQCGFASAGIQADDFLTPGRIVELGIDPYRIDLITGISGVSFEEAWNGRVFGELDGIRRRF